MAMSCAESPCCIDPLTLCAGVGRVVIDVMEEFMLLDKGSAVLGDNCDGL